MKLTAADVHAHVHVHAHAIVQHNKLQQTMAVLIQIMEIILAKATIITVTYKNLINGIGDFSYVVYK